MAHQMVYRLKLAKRFLQKLRKQYLLQTKELTMPVPFDGDDIMFALFVLISLIIAFIVHLTQIGKSKFVAYSFFTFAEI